MTGIPGRPGNGRPGMKTLVSRWRILLCCMAKNMQKFTKQGGIFVYWTSSTYHTSNVGRTSMCI